MSLKALIAHRRSVDEPFRDAMREPLADNFSKIPEGHFLNLGGLKKIICTKIFRLDNFSRASNHFTLVKGWLPKAPYRRLGR